MMKHSQSILTILVLFLIIGSCGSGGNDASTEGSSLNDTSGIGEGISQEKIRDTFSEGNNSTPESDFELSVRSGFENAAKAFMESYREKRFIEFSQYMHPTIIKVYGGKAAFIEQLKQNQAQDKQEYRRWESGPIEAFTAAKDDRGRITGWYAVIPIKRWLETAKDSEYQLQWLGGQSLDGKSFHFIDITEGDKGMIYRIMPDMRFLLENLEDLEVPET